VNFISAPFGNYIQPKSALAVTGTWTLKHRPGRFKQVLKTVRYSFKERGWINKLGLRNLGITHALESHDNQHEVLSIAGIEEYDWNRFSDIIPDDYNIEFNLSCPNVDECSPAGIKNMINESRQWCIAKIPPGQPPGRNGTVRLIDELVDMGFTTIHACNAIPHSRGAISGKQVKACSLNIIKYIKHVHPHVEVIGGGGITRLADIQDYYDVGADHVSLGSVCFTPWRLPALLRN
jgi:dihydroorotate dehydrogenase